MIFYFYLGKREHILEKKKKEPINAAGRQKVPSAAHTPWFVPLKSNKGF